MIGHNDYVDSTPATRVLENTAKHKRYHNENINRIQIRLKILTRAIRCPVLLFCLHTTEDTPVYDVGLRLPEAPMVIELTVHPSIGNIFAQTLVLQMTPFLDSWLVPILYIHAG